METAYILFTQVATMFLLIIVGYLCYKSKLISRNANKQMSNLVLTIVNAALILKTFQSGYSGDLIKNLGICFIFSCITLMIGILVSYIMKLHGGSKRTVSTERYAIIYPNSAYMGIPLLLATIGPTGVMYASAFVVAFNLFAWTQGVTMMTGKTDKKLLITALTSPVIICIFIGLPIFLLQIKFPTPVASAVSYLSDLMTPLSMLVAGCFIAQANLKKAFTDFRVYLNSAVKLIVVPLIMLVVLTLLPFNNEVRLSILILAAAPSATNTMMFASRFGGDVEKAGALFSVSTILCIITIPLITMLANILW